MKLSKKFMLAGAGVLMLAGLSACGNKSTTKKTASTKPKTTKVAKVNKDVKTLQKKDKKLAKVSFNKKNGQIVYCVNNKNKVRNAQQTSAKQVSWLQKQTKDNNLQPKVVMSKKANQQNKKNMNKNNKMNMKNMKGNKKNQKQMKNNNKKQMPKKNNQKKNK